MVQIDMTHPDYAQLDALAQEYGGRFYVMYPDRFRDNLAAFRAALLSRFDQIVMGYSFKTNYVPALCRIAASMGCWAEVVSGMEYALAIRLGYPPDRIIFNGPVKSEAEIALALEQGALVNLDSIQEVQWAADYQAAHPGQQVSVGLRINIELRDGEGESAIQNGLRNGRFGLTEADLYECMPIIQASGMAVVSVHGHTSSSNRAVENYALIASRLLKVCQDYALNTVRYFNVGGGFFGAPAQGLDVRGKPSYDDYARGLAEVLQADPWFVQHQPALVIEPGASVVANVFDFAARVHTVKQIQDQQYVVVDGSVFDIKPSMHSLNLPFQVLYQPDVSQEDNSVVPAHVVGSTCMEKDIILRAVPMVMPRHGDFVLVHGVGAYTVVFNPVFINALAPILAWRDGRATCVRRPQTINDILSLYEV